MDRQLQTEIPYAPFNKSARLGKIADWNSQYTSRSRSGPDTINTAFQEEEPHDSSEFQLVMEAGRGQKKSSRFGQTFTGASSSRFRFRRGGGRGSSIATGAGAGDGSDALRGKASKHLPRQLKGRRQELARQRWASYSRWGGGISVDQEPSVVVNEATWNLQADFDFDKLRGAAIAPGDVQLVGDLRSCGSLGLYDTNFDKLSKKEATLAKRFVAPDSLPLPVTTSKDPIMAQLIESGAGQVYLTEDLLSLIMTAERSATPWDLVIQRIGDSQVIIDKRDKSTLSFDTVNETASEPPHDDPNNITPMESTTNINAPAPLSLEATRINANFQQQVLQPDSRSQYGEQPNPFESETAAKLSRGYRYRKWNVGGIDVVVRCSIDGQRKVKDTTELLKIRALNEYDARADSNWRQKLSTQQGAIIATEMKNNSAKIARWLLEAQLSGSQAVVLGYVSRANFKANTTHVILASHLHRPHELISQLSLDVTHSWAVFHLLAKELLRLPPGRYCLLREPNIALLSLFQIPYDETFEAVPVATEDDASTLPPVSS